MALPLVINPGDSGHISHHEEIHAFLDPIVSPFVIAQSGQGASLPAAGTAGRFFLDTDDSVLYRDSGSGWEPVHDMLTSWVASLLAADSNIAGLKIPTAATNKAVAQSINDSTWTTITMPAEDFDNDGLHDVSVSTGRITATVDGIYLVGAYISFDPNATGDRRIRLLANGTDTIAADNRNTVGALGSTQCAISGLALLAASDYIEVQGLQSSGGALDVNAGRLWAFLVSTA